MYLQSSSSKWYLCALLALVFIIFKLVNILAVQRYQRKGCRQLGITAIAILEGTFIILERIFFELSLVILIKCGLNLKNYQRGLKIETTGDIINAIVVYLSPVVIFYLLIKSIYLGYKYNDKVRSKEIQETYQFHVILGNLSGRNECTPYYRLFFLLRRIILALSVIIIDKVISV